MKTFEHLFSKALGSSEPILEAYLETKTTLLLIYRSKSSNKDFLLDISGPLCYQVLSIECRMGDKQSSAQQHQEQSFLLENNQNNT